MTLPLGARAYVRLGDIMGWGNRGLRGVEETIIPVQDLSKVLLDSRVKRTLYTSSAKATINGNTDFVLEWGDASDWAEVQINGVVSSADIQMPQPGTDRIITAMSLSVSGATPAEYTSCEIARSAPTTVAVSLNCVRFGAPTAGHRTASIDAPYLLPQALNLNELQIIMRLVGTGVDGTATLAVSMLSAERGVMNLYPGV